MLSMLITNIIVVPYNIIHGIATIIYFLSILYMLSCYNNKMTYISIYTAFGVFAILNLYFERITVLAQSLGMPLLFLLLIEHIEYESNNLARDYKKSVAAVSGWLSSFILFWSIKWGITTLATGNNIFLNAISRFGRYADTSPGENLPGYENAGRLLAVCKNLASLLPSHGEALPFIFVVIAMIIIVMVYLWIKNKVSVKDIKPFLPEVSIMCSIPMALYLGAPYMSLFNATVFAYRYQCLWIFGGLGIYSWLVGRNRTGISGVLETVRRDTER